MSSKTPPGPDGVPVLGSALESIRSPMEFRRECVNKYDEGIIEVQMANTTMYMLTDPEYIEQVLVMGDQHFIKPSEMREKLVGVFGDGLLLSENEFWRKQRDTINPAFYPERIETYTDTMVEFIQRLVDEWEDGETFDMRWQMDRLALQVVMKTLFDIDFHGEEEKILTPIKQINLRYQPSNVSAYLPEWVPTKVNRAYNEGESNLLSEVEKMIRQRRANGGNRDETDLLDRLIDATDDDDHQMTPETLRDELTTVALGASGPVGLALTYTWYLLARDDRVTEKLHDEVDRVLDGEPASLETIPELEYTRKVIKESLRMYPPVWTVLREPEKDVTIGDYDVPEGTPLSMTPWAIHRNEEFYDDPDEFRPERWDGDLEDEIPDCAYIPFGAGPRTCIGKHFSLKEIQLAVPTIAQQFDVEYVPDEPLDFSIAHILEPAGEVEMTVRKR